MPQKGCKGSPRHIARGQNPHNPHSMHGRHQAWSFPKGPISPFFFRQLQHVFRTIVYIHTHMYINQYIKTFSPKFSSALSFAYQGSRLPPGIPMNIPAGRPFGRPGGTWPASCWGSSRWAPSWCGGPPPRGAIRCCRSSPPPRHSPAFGHKSRPRADNTLSLKESLG
jgi:hypothetical protein